VDSFPFYLVLIDLVLAGVLAAAFWPTLVKWVPALRVWTAQRQLRPCLGFPGLEDGRLEGDQIVGAFAGYELTLSLGTRRVGDTTEQTLRYALRLPGRAYSQELPEARYLRESLGEEGAQAEGVRKALAHFGKIPNLELEIEAGWLTVERGITGYAKGKTSLSATFSAMAGLVPLLARTEFEIQVQARDTLSAEETDADVSLAWSERGGGQPLCPYCRDDLDAPGLGLSRCESCHTVHHSECLEELGRCAVFGCSGERTRPLRA
tara:strand:+ start:488 stop:1279 length:792 start_codon:yes stop_codon:yes gene_type:complete